MIVNIVLAVAAIIVALIVGILLRRRLLNYLKQTVLDQWITQTFGVIAFALPLVAGLIGALAIWNANLLQNLQTISGFDNKNLPTLIMNLVATFLIIALGLGVARTVRNLTVRGLSEKRVDINIRILFGRILYAVTLIIVGFWLLSIWSIPSGIPVAAISVITVALSFSVQDIVKDLVAGFYLLLEHPFYIGDQISITIAPTVIYVGKVEAVELRATKLRLVGGEEITIPNAILFGNAVINNTFYGERRATIIVHLLPADYTQEHTSDQILQELQTLATVLKKPEPIVHLNGFIDGKFVLAVRFWMPSAHVHDISEAMLVLHALFPDADLEAREPSGLM